MNLFTYFFTPLLRERIGFCLSVMIVCLCLSLIEAWAYDPEFERIVPDVRGLTVDKARSLLNARGIKNLEIHDESTSLKPKGTISNQQPNPGDALNITRPLQVWVSQPPETPETDIQVIKPIILPRTPPPREPPVPSPPNAIISPEKIVVHQGETALFKSRSTPREGISETWTGPGNQQGAGTNFEVRTESLEPGSYVVALTVTNKQEQRARARATLVVTEAPMPPQQPGGSRDSGIEETQHNYGARITSDTQEARQSQPVTFTAELIPGRSGARFQFHFGDGNHVETRDATVTHAYKTAGTFEAFVQVLSGHSEVIAESDHIEIVVHGALVRQGGGEPTPPQPSSPDYTWLWIGIMILGVIGAGYVLVSKIGKPRLRLELKGDAGTQYMEGDVSRLVGPELCLVPVSDIGEQVVTEDRKPFVREERWENE